MDAFIILQQMLVLFGMMIVGFFCYKKDWIDDHSYGKMSKIVVNIMNPLLVIDGVLSKDNDGDLHKLLLNLLMVCIYFAFLVIISIPIVKILKPEKENTGLYRLMTIFSNVGFMGIPVVSALYGKEVIIYIIFYMQGYNFLLYTYGILLARSSAKNKDDEINTKGHFFDNLKLMVNAGVIAGIIAIIFFIFHVQVPKPVGTFISYLGQCVVPLSMILIGASMAQHDLKSIFNDIKMYWFLLIRLIVIPVLAALIVRNIPIDAQILGVFILMLAMPVGSIVVLVAMEQGADATCCTKGSVVSTLLSIITIPIVALLLP